MATARQQETGKPQEAPIGAFEDNVEAGLVRGWHAGAV
jgi:hypothetical protein